MGYLTVAVSICYTNHQIFFFTILQTSLKIKASATSFSITLASHSIISADSHLLRNDTVQATFWFSICHLLPAQDDKLN